MRVSMLRGVAAATALVFAACTSSSRVIDRESRQVRIRLESDPTGATPLVNGKVVAPATPAEVTVPYTYEKRIARDGDYDTGLLLVVSGVVGVLAGIGLIAWGASSNDEFGAETTLGTSMGTLGILYGLGGVGGGAYLMYDARPDEIRTNTVPYTMTVGLDLPKLGLREVVLKHKNRDQADFGTDFGVIRYRARQDRWEVPNLPLGLKYTYKSDEARIAAAVAELGGGVVTTAPFLGGASAKSSATVVAVFDIDVRGQSMDAGLVTRLSDYLAMRLATERRFSVVPRDQLRARLRNQKKKSYDKCFDQSCQIEIGKELAAEKTLSSAIVRFGQVCKVTSVLYDLRTSASEGGATASGDCNENALVASLEEVVAKLSN